MNDRVTIQSPRQRCAEGALPAHTVAPSTPHLPASSLRALLQGTPYLSYSYAYPHKSAYRPLNPPVPLPELWSAEQRDALFLYIHIPFCEMRCGFCNLFTTANPGYELEAAYLESLERQAQRVHTALGGATFARFAIGGGTPTYLTPAALHRLCDLAALFGVDLARLPSSVETSPGTATLDRLQVLRERGVERVSIGIQSFNEAELKAIGRSQHTADVIQALERLRAVGFPCLNIDLMYGLPDQSIASWLDTLHTALRYAPEELYLYPLYVRPLTGMTRMQQSWDDQRLDCYRAGRDLLLAAGYEQVSMRMFRAHHAPTQSDPVYCCQEDGMVGLGCGARSYTSGLHYSSEYAVGAQGVRAILADYLRQPDAAFDLATWGVQLNADEQRRRYSIKSLLRRDGLSLGAYAARFGTAALDDLPQLTELVAYELATCSATHLCLTPAGIERSDTIGPWLYSAHMHHLMERSDLR